MPFGCLGWARDPVHPGEVDSAMRSRNEKDGEVAPRGWLQLQPFHTRLRPPKVAWRISEFPVQKFATTKEFQHVTFQLFVCFRREGIVMQNLLPTEQWREAWFAETQRFQGFRTFQTVCLFKKKRL